MKKKTDFVLLFAYLALIASVYFAFVQYTVLSVICIYSLFVFYKSSRGNKQLLFWFATALIVLIIGISRTFFGMG